MPSFKGVPFYVDTTETGFGRRIAYHEYPQHDSPFPEDLGRRGRRFEIECFVIGDDWEAQRNALVKACESPGSGILDHPDYGIQKVSCDSCTASESKTNERRMTRFKIAFLEDGYNGLSTSPLSTQRQLQGGAASASANIGNSFARQFNFSQPSQDVQSAANAVLMGMATNG